MGATGGGAGGYSKVSCGGTAATGCAGGAVPGFIIRRGSVKGRFKAAAVPGRVAVTTEHDGVGIVTGVDAAAGAGFIVEALLFSSTAVAGSVGGKPVGAAAEAGHGAAVCMRDGVVRKVRLRGE